MEREFKPERVLVYGENCIGAKKTGTDIMISFINEEKDFSYMDILLTNDVAKNLIVQLEKQIEENKL